MNEKIKNGNLSMGFIGGGRVTRILFDGWKKAGISLGSILVSDTNSEVLKGLQSKFPEIEICSDNTKAAVRDIVFLSLHPPAIGTIIGDIKAALKPKAIFVSLAPKWTIANLSVALGGFSRIVRIIPNAPSIINKGYNPVAFAPSLPKEDQKELVKIFKVLGVFPEVAEEKLEAYAIITAMGPTYLWFQLQELKKLGESFGLSSKELDKAICEMVAGAGKTLCKSGLSYEEVINLIPVKPLGEEEQTICNMYEARLNGLYQKLKG
jgi:pyrroline-5-carboxylate reductase